MKHRIRKSNAETLKFVQLADIHIEPNYAEVRHEKCSNFGNNMGEIVQVHNEIQAEFAKHSCY